MDKKIFNLLFFVFILCSNANFGKTLVLEYKDELINEDHGNHVRFINCLSSEKESECKLQYFEDPLELDHIDFSNFLFVNMSFSQQMPKKPNFHPLDGDEVYEEKLVEYELKKNKYNNFKSYFHQAFDNYPETLFTIASGNGFYINGLFTKGIGLGKIYKSIPAMNNGRNVLKVAAINKRQINIKKLDEITLSDYSNYGLEYVDVAAPIMPNNKGEYIKGTSFAAPYVNLLAKELKKIAPQLTASHLREILMKSCYVNNLEQAITATIDYQESGINSDIYKATYSLKKETRDLYLQKLNGVILVKCGGSIIPQVAKQCAKNISLSSITESCLKAHKEILNTSDSKLRNLRRFWQLRSL